MIYCRSTYIINPIQIYKFSKLIIALPLTAVYGIAYALDRGIEKLWIRVRHTFKYSSQAHTIISVN